MSGISDTVPSGPVQHVHTCYIVRHKQSGWVMPETKTGKGGSWSELSDPDTTQPRLFVTKKAATNFIGQWCRGQVKAIHYPSPDIYGETSVVLKIAPVRSRKKEDLEVVRAKVSW